ncbi:MAG: hypothetical protein NC244_11790 [Alistipes senegalensis]|nr:hypothetical protein [Alistipes senegalensis]
MIFIFYDNLKKECERQGLKITPIVLECGGNKGSLSGWKKGASPNSDIVMKLSVRLNVPTDYLLFGKEETSRIIEMPTISLTENEAELLNLFKQLSDREQLKLIGKVEGMVEELRKNNLQENV